MQKGVLYDPPLGDISQIALIISKSQLCILNLQEAAEAAAAHKARAAKKKEGAKRPRGGGSAGGIDAAIAAVLEAAGDPATDSDDETAGLRPEYHDSPPALHSSMAEPTQAMGATRGGMMAGTGAGGHGLDWDELDAPPAQQPQHAGSQWAPPTLEGWVQRGQRQPQRHEHGSGSADMMPDGSGGGRQPAAGGSTGWVARKRRGRDSSGDAEPVGQCDNWVL